MAAAGTIRLPWLGTPLWGDTVAVGESGARVRTATLTKRRRMPGRATMQAKNVALPDTAMNVVLTDASLVKPARYKAPTLKGSTIDRKNVTARNNLIILEI